MICEREEEGSAYPWLYSTFCVVSLHNTSTSISYFMLVPCLHYEGMMAGMVSWSNTERERIDCELVCM